MSDLLEFAVQAVQEGKMAFCRYITANDVGTTGSHQSGFYIPKDSWSLFFDTPGTRGENKSNYNIRIEWNNDFHTDSRAIYYGVGSRNEYRVTCFGRGFPFLERQYSGSLLVMVKMGEKEYKAFVLSLDEDIDGFFSFFDVSPLDNQHLIHPTGTTPVKPNINTLILELLSAYQGFPTTNQMSIWARGISEKIGGFTEYKAIQKPDDALVDWINSEYQLFKAFEEREWSEHSTDIKTCQEMIDFSNSLLNRRKARAGKSLEHHLSHIFTIENLKFEEQVITEGRKRPDFIFPDGVSYHNILFPGEGLTFLGAKTTCKDRWRQVLNEANRIPHKYLFTLQQGISTAQLDEMRIENLTLVIPQANLTTFAKSHRDQLLTLNNFIGLVREKQEKYCVL